MQRTTIHSDAFDRASLRSERYRIVGILLVCGFYAAMNLVRLFVLQGTDRHRVRVYVIWWGILAAYEGVMLWITTRAEGRGREVKGWVWVLNIIVECLLPSLALMGLTADKSYLGPYRALYSSSVLIYCLLIILSTLRLRPLMCVLAGAMSAGGYLAVYGLTLHLAPENPNRNAMPQMTFIMTPTILLIAGMLAAGVARQIRGHVIAALTEVETRLKLDRIEHELSTARSIQMGLLPRTPPSIAGYDIAGWSQPASQTGGDYYDWMELPGGKILFTIADATGHGIGPALLVAACRAYFRAVATHTDPLERITHQVDQLLTADIPEGRFITAAIALLEPAEHRLSLYSAGHAPMYLYTAAGDRVSMFDADQPPLGTGMDGDGDGSQARVIHFADGDALVLITDGFFECANQAGELRGTLRLGESIRAHQSLPANELIARLHHDVLQYSDGTPQADDLTAVVIKRRR